MNLLTGFTESAKQTITFPLTSGGVFELSLEFRPQQTGWFFDFAYGTYVVRGQRLTLHMNILRQLRNVIPFGVAVVSSVGYEPQTQEALSDGSVSIYLFEDGELEDVEAYLDGTA